MVNIPINEEEPKEIEVQVVEEDDEEEEDNILPF